MLVIVLVGKWSVCDVVMPNATELLLVYDDLTYFKHFHLSRCFFFWLALQPDPSRFPCPRHLVCFKCVAPLDLSHVCSSPPPCSGIMTGSYNNFFRIFDRNTKRDITLEASKDTVTPMQVLKPRRVGTGNKKRKEEISVDSLDFNRKILHTAWHPKENIIAVAATNNLYIFQENLPS